MRAIFLDCPMGAAGDMLTAALLELLPEPDAFVREFNDLPLEGVEMAAKRAESCGISGTHVSMRIYGAEEPIDGAPFPAHTHAHFDATFPAISALIASLPLDAQIRADATAVYRLIAQAEAHAHQTDITHVHFHEVGTMDAIADVLAVTMLIAELAPARIYASPIRVGSGTVRCAHGTLPVPAPATAHLLRGIPYYAGDLRGEFCTPTGAALLRHFVDKFEFPPNFQAQTSGYGMGTRSYKIANCLRATLGTCE